MEDQTEEYSKEGLICRILGHVDVLAKDYVTGTDFFVCMRCGRFKLYDVDGRRVNWFWHRLLKKTREIWRREDGET